MRLPSEGYLECDGWRTLTRQCSQNKHMEPGKPISCFTRDTGHPGSAPEGHGRLQTDFLCGVDHSGSTATRSARWLYQWRSTNTRKDAPESPRHHGERKFKARHHTHTWPAITVPKATGKCRPWFLGTGVPSGETGEPSGCVPGHGVGQGGGCQPQRRPGAERASPSPGSSVLQFPCLTKLGC